MPKRQIYLWVCTNARPADHPLGSCAARGAKDWLERLKQRIADGGQKHTIRACASSCLDVCWAGPAVAITGDALENNPAFVGRLDLSQDPAALVAQLGDAIKSKTDPSRVLQAFLLNTADFDRPTKL